MSDHVSKVAIGARQKTTQDLLAVHAQGVTFLAEGNLPALFEEVMAATETVLRERGVLVPSRYARPVEAVAR